MHIEKFMHPNISGQKGQSTQHKMDLSREINCIRRELFHTIWKSINRKHGFCRIQQSL